MQSSTTHGIDLIHRSPTPDEVMGVRRAVQLLSELGITDAQDWCANSLHTSRRAFQQWETGARRMHPAFWELLILKFEMLRKTSKS